MQSPLKCPQDQSVLTKRPYEADIQVDVCGQCDGVWLDKGELERIQETVENDYREELEKIPKSTVQAYRIARDQQGHEALACPSCGSQMSEREHGYCSQINIDVCAECQGIWLDAGELQALEVFFERSKAETRDVRQGFWKSLRNLVFSGILPE